MSDKRISQLIEREAIENNDVLPIVALGASTTNKVTISTIEDWMQTHLDLGVTSVGITKTGDALAITGSPITSAGNINIAFAGTSGQYVNGAGNLVTFPSLTGYVPYTGATTNVNLGEYGLTAGYLGFDLTPTGTPTGVGTLSWDSFYRTLQLKDGTGATTLQIGQEERTLVHNNTGATLTDGQVVYVTGSTGELPSVALATNTSEGTSSVTFGVVTESIPNGEDGFVTTSGIVHGINTLAFNEGDAIYLGATAGTFTNVKPVAPANSVLVGYIIKKAGGNGSIFVKIQNGYELKELHDVLINGIANNEGIFWDSATSLWKNKTIASALGYTPADAARNLTINGTTYNLTADRTWNVGTVTSVGLSAPTGFSVSGSPVTSSGTLALGFASGYSLPTNIKQSNWDDAYTFVANFPTQTGNAGKFLTNNGSVLSWETVIAGVQSVMASSPLFSSGGANPNITIQVANTSQNGYLSSTDWNTFNNKASTAALTNYLPLAGGTLTGPLNGTNATFEGLGKFWDGTKGLTIGAYPFGAGYGSIYVTTLTPNSANYSFAASSSETVLSVPTGGSISLAIQATAQLRINSNGFVRIGSAASTANERLDVDGAVQVRSDSQGFSTTLSVGMLDFYAGYTRLLSFGNSTTFGGFDFYSAKQNNVGGFSAMRLSTLNNLLIGTTTDRNVRLQVAKSNESTAWISASFAGIGNTDVVVIGNLEGPTIGGHNAALNSWSTLAINPDGGNVMIGTRLNEGFTLNVNGTGKFTSTTFTQGINITGNGGFYNSANKFGLDQYLGASRFYSNGADTTTKGSYEFHINSSNGSLDVIALSILNSGTAIFSNTIIAYGSATFLGQFGNGNNVNEKIIQFTRASASTDIVNIQGINAGVGAGNIALQASGANVGIGTINIGGKLHVKIDTDLNIAFNSIGGVARISSFNDAITANQPLIINGEDLRFNAGGSERMRINSVGDIQFPNSIAIKSIASSGYIATYANGGGLYWGGLASTNQMHLNSAGQLGIGTITQNAKLRVYDSNSWISGAFGGAGGSHQVVIGNYNGVPAIGGHTTGLNGWTALALNFDGGQPVYIGTTTGVSGGGQLQVNGNVNINGVFQINGVTIGGGGGSGVTGSGTTNYLTKWTGSTTLGNSVIQDNGTNVGIGFLGGAKLFVGTAANNASGDISQIAQFIAPRATIAYPLTVSSAGTGVTNDEIRITFNYGAGFSATAYVASYLDNVLTAQTGLTFGTYNGGLIQSMRLTAEGNLLIGSNSNNGYKLQINGSASFAYGFLSVYRGSSSPNDILVGNDGNRFYIGGNQYVAGSVTATGGFFDTSDMRLKSLIQHDYKLTSIASVKAKLYTKNGRKELGYYAQDVQGLLDFAVNEGEDGYLSLSYAQVHTAKIAVIEDEVTILKRKVTELESKLQKYEA